MTHPPIPKHPGRQDWEIGITDIVYRPKRLYARLQGKDPTPVTTTGSMLKGTVLHDWFFRDRPGATREAWVSRAIFGTSYKFGGHIDCYRVHNGTLTVEDLKTSDRYGQPTDATVDKWLDQVALYGICAKRGYTYRDGKWELPTEPIDHVRLVVHYWGPGEDAIQPEYVVLEGEEAEQRMDQAWSYYSRQVKDMLAGSWSPPATTAEVETEERILDKDAEELLTRGSQLKRTIADAERELEDINATLLDTAEPGTINGPGVKATIVAPSIKSVKDSRRLEKILAEHDLDLAAFQRTVTTKRLDEEALDQWLEAHDVPANTYTEEKQARRAYVRWVVDDDEEGDT